MTITSWSRYFPWLGVGLQRLFHSWLDLLRFAMQPVGAMYVAELGLKRSSPSRGLGLT